PCRPKSPALCCRRRREGSGAVGGGNPEVALALDSFERRGDGNARKPPADPMKSIARLNADQVVVRLARPPACRGGGGSVVLDDERRRVIRCQESLVSPQRRQLGPFNIHLDQVGYNGDLLNEAHHWNLDSLAARNTSGEEARLAMVLGIAGGMI